MNIFKPAWDLLQKKATMEDNGRPKKIKNKYLAAVEEICEFGYLRASRIVVTFPLYTLHDETHINNVIYHIMNLLGKKGQEIISRDELALIIMSAYCHDIGMSCSEAEKDKIITSQKYIRYSNGKGEEVFSSYIREHHHERVEDVLSEIEWPAVFRGIIDKWDLCLICKSHGESIDIIRSSEYDSQRNYDIRMCSLMLRLGDILDFDADRAPLALFNYGFDNIVLNDDVEYSINEWKKHIQSDGFNSKCESNSIMYSATCSDPYIEKDIRAYLDLVDNELLNCGKLLINLSGKWGKLNIPSGVDRSQVKGKDYVSGNFLFTMSSKALCLFSGMNLYGDKNAFIRELYQNSVDAVNTRKILDPKCLGYWEPSIKIEFWDEGAYTWFQIEDNGTGMNQDIIENYFMNIGVSYYTSKEFQSVIEHNSDKNYSPISKYGVGILSCFSEDEDTIMEISTLRFGEKEAPLRISIYGLSGLFYLSDMKQHHKGKPMPNQKMVYRDEPGTTIAVRLKRKIGVEDINKFIRYPDVAVEINQDGILPKENMVIEKALNLFSNNQKCFLVNLEKYFKNKEVSGYIVCGNDDRIKTFNAEFRSYGGEDTVEVIKNGILIDQFNPRDYWSHYNVNEENLYTIGKIFIHNKLPLNTNLSRTGKRDMLPFRVKLGLTIVGRYLTNSGYNNFFYKAFRLQFPSMEELVKELDALNMFSIIKINVLVPRGMFYSEVIDRVCAKNEVLVASFTFGYYEDLMKYETIPDMTRIQFAAISPDIAIFESCYSGSKEERSYNWGRSNEQYLTAKQSIITENSDIDKIFTKVPKQLKNDLFVYKFTEYESTQLCINLDHELAPIIIEQSEKGNSALNSILDEVKKSKYYDKSLEDKIRNLVANKKNL